MSVDGGTPPRRDRRKLRHAPDGWQAGTTRVRYEPGCVDDLEGVTGTFVGNSMPLPGVVPTSWLGVLVKFDNEPDPLDVDPGDLVVIPADGEATR